MALDIHYARHQRIEGRHILKKDSIRQILRKYFNESPIWDYGLKIRIASEIGMTFNQVSKWNWDHRKRLGMKTNSRKLRNKGLMI